MTGASAVAPDLIGRTDAVARGIRQAATDAMRAETAAGKALLRADVMSGLREGRKVANAWRGDTYPATGRANDPAGVLETRVPAIIDAFTNGVTIHAVNGKWLAIPTPKYRGFLKNFGDRGVKGQFAQTTKNWPDIIADLLASGKPHFAIEPGGRRGFIYVKREQREVIGFLVKQAVLGKRFKGADLLAAIARHFPAQYETRVEQLLSRELGRL